MKRMIGRAAARGRRRLRPAAAQWLTLFGIGIMLGITLAAFKLSAAAVDEHRAKGRQTAIEQVIMPSNERTSPEKRDKPDRGLTAGKGESDSELEQIIVSVYLTKEKRIERVPLEVYVRGVVAAEMPMDFELEALKAQAIAARTYIVRRLALHDSSGMPQGNEAKGAKVTDTVDHQVYVPLAELTKRWPEDKRTSYSEKLKQAIDQTKGRIITYEGEPIQAVFFSTSNGYTENSEDYWVQEIPYLRSVASPWDKELSPRYKETIQFDLAEFYRKLGIEADGSGKPVIRVIHKTAGDRIGDLIVGKKRLTGREVREKLGLASSQFIWTIKEDSITFTTYGYGHGVGMSQWGANGMAKTGVKAEDILAHYYSGTKVEQASKLASRY
ncbi:stage II sporulation protein D [Paenibacillus radicis (ex Gao et al. 2016)]|uniref:Stage II sporulation protein D n=1 Tax=Paenibacillus radicis (ex Gao et al. 2016) TaxID=1737354 RepID=A0A917M8K5_9BACL|nr:stage II sporulation protein D [Paenibacillus radicis (ex Gao et al. 2016)]GGG84223.1 stage II sporulation protein D [Paenibacillus radicis (ex Gao et al. 2016)]